MKILSRILLIFMAAALIAGAAYSMVSASGSSSGVPRFEIVQRPAGFGPGTDAGHGSAGGLETALALSMGMIKNVVVIAIITLTYLNMNAWLCRKQQQTVPIR